MNHSKNKTTTQKNQFPSDNNDSLEVTRTGIKAKGYLTITIVVFALFALGGMWIYTHKNPDTSKQTTSTSAPNSPAIGTMNGNVIYEKEK